MASIVFGAGVSHSPLLTLHAEEWVHRAQADYNNPALNLSDGRFVSYQELLAEVGPRYADNVSIEKLSAAELMCQEALDDIGEALERARCDLVVIIGDDQGELFSAANQPTISIFHGDDIVMNDSFGHEDNPKWMRSMAEGYLMDEIHRLQGAGAVAYELIQRMIDHDIDVSAAATVEDAQKAGFGHAFGFIAKRVMRGRATPILPVLLNTYFPPNVPSSARAHVMGRALRASLEVMGAPHRVAVIASGGLSHFVVDEDLDRHVLAHLGEGGEAALKSIGRGALHSGSSEILNWVMTAGAVDHLSLGWTRYIPVRRTPAGTGCGMGFAVWREAKAS